MVGTVLCQGAPFNLFNRKMSTGSSQQLSALLFARQSGQEQRRVVGSVALMDAGATLEKLRHDFGAS